jgi:hypothetical protein
MSIKQLLQHKTQIIIIIPICLFGLLLLLNTLTKPSTPQQVGTAPLFPTKFLANPNTAKAPVQYDEKATQKMLDKINNKVPVSPDDTAVKERLVTSIRNSSNTLYETQLFRVTYVKPSDLLFVEIKTRNIIRTKQDAIKWLTEQGLSNEAICTLPIVFYLNNTAAMQLRSEKTIFNPLAEGC